MPRRDIITLGHYQTQPRSQRPAGFAAAWWVKVQDLCLCLPESNRGYQPDRVRRACPRVSVTRSWRWLSDMWNDRGADAGPIQRPRPTDIIPPPDNRPLNLPWLSQPIF